MPEDEMPIEQPPVEEPPIEPIYDPVERAQVIESTSMLIQELSPLIRQEDITEIRQKSIVCDLNEILDYLGANIPEVRDYLSSISATATDEEKVAVIKSGLKKRAESMVPDYVIPPTFLGNDVEEARSKQENVETRYATQYHQVPFVKPVFRGRSAVDNPYYETPKRTDTRFRSM